MSFAIAYSSKTGNTAFLAEALKAALPQEACAYYGPPGDAATDAATVFVGFWTDKGTCDEATAAFLEGLREKRVFLFGTAGFGANEEYYARILDRVRAHLDGSNTVAGSYMCQGRMPASVRQRYAAMEAQAPEKARELVANFDRALSHPDERDVDGLKQALARCEIGVRL